MATLPYFNLRFRWHREKPGTYRCRMEWTRGGVHCYRMYSVASDEHRNWSCRVWDNWLRSYAEDAEQCPVPANFGTLKAAKEGVEAHARRRLAAGH